MKSEELRDTTRHWNAGDAGCARLILGLKRNVERLRTGEILSITARNAAAHIDISYWCHMTGHVLLSASHPNYTLQKKANETIEENYNV